MFSYYGSKIKIAKYYPKPQYDLVIEPFAGAAWYSLINKHPNVLLNDINPIIHKIWKWLIYKCSPETLKNYSDFYLGDSIKHLKLNTAHKDLIGFCLNRGSINPCNIVTKWNCQVKSRPIWASTLNYQLLRACELLPLVKNWKITKVTYEKVPIVKATWFIDPPYQFGGNLYTYNSIDYEKLKKYIYGLKGQVILCENSKSNWIKTKPLIKIQGQRNKTTETIFTNNF